GGSGCGGDCGDTWTFDGSRWSKVSSSPAPPPRDEASMVYDAAAGRVVLFGGHGSTCTGNYCADTWSFDGSHWHQVTVTPAPPGRDNASMVYDSAVRRLVLFGGECASGYCADTWLFDGAAWHAVTSAPAPAMRSLASMVYDPGMKRT